MGEGGDFSECHPPPCVPAPTALPEPQPGAAVPGNRSPAWRELLAARPGEGLQQQLRHPPGPSKLPPLPAWFPPQSRGGNRTRTRFAGGSHQTQRVHVCEHGHAAVQTPPAVEAARRGAQRIGGASFVTATAPRSDAGSKGPRGPGRSRRKSSPRWVISYSQRRHVGYLKPTLLSPLRKVTELVFYPLIRRCRQNLLPTQLS